jgi:hypothetical protein
MTHEAQVAGVLHAGERSDLAALEAKVKTTEAEVDRLELLRAEADHAHRLARLALYEAQGLGSSRDALWVRALEFGPQEEVDRLFALNHSDYVRERAKQEERYIAEEAAKKGSP